MASFSRAPRSVRDNNARLQAVPFCKQEANQASKSRPGKLQASHALAAERRRAGCAPLGWVRLGSGPRLFRILGRAVLLRHRGPGQPPPALPIRWSSRKETSTNKKLPASPALPFLASPAAEPAAAAAAPAAPELPPAPPAEAEAAAAASPPLPEADRTPPAPAAPAAAAARAPFSCSSPLLLARLFFLPLLLFWFGIADGGGGGRGGGGSWWGGGGGGCYCCRRVSLCCCRCRCHQSRFIAAPLSSGAAAKLGSRPLSTHITQRPSRLPAPPAWPRERAARKQSRRERRVSLVLILALFSLRVSYPPTHSLTNAVARCLSALPPRLSSSPLPPSWPGLNGDSGPRESESLEQAAREGKEEKEEEEGAAHSSSKRARSRWGFLWAWPGQEAPFQGRRLCPA